MKILIACEYSGTVRRAFALKGHDVTSCDILPTELPCEANEYHYQGNVLDILDDGWDMMIGHPPCTYLSYAGVAFWNKPGRLEKRLDALDFFAKLWLAPIDKICLENPKGCASPAIAKYSQEIQPYFFGDNHVKTTWLWLKGLEPLKYDLKKSLFFDGAEKEKPKPISVDNTKRNKARYFTDAKVRDPKKRALFWPGIANAMAQQWG